MKRILAISLMLILMCFTAWAQPTPTSTPPSPESLGLTPPDPSASTQAPPASESDQALMSTSQYQASAAAPEGTAKATATSTSTQMVVPQGVAAPNYLYIPYYPSTTAGCYFGQWIPMWMDVRGSGPLYVYEWYPDGRLVSSYLAYISYPGWQKMWFYGDAVGWHTLQYYCNGWSNYIYVYVQGTTGYPVPSPSPYPPTSTPPYPPTTYPPGSGSGCKADVIINSDWMKGYSVYLDGAYIGKDGQGNAYDGVFSFKVAGNQQHTIDVYNQGYSYSNTKSYSCAGTYTLTI
jgi:hypothetical protein